MRTLFAEVAEPTLDQVAGIIAGLRRPSGSVEDVVAGLDALAAAGPNTQSPDDLLRYLFAEVGFRGNAGQYYDPDNSYLHRVLETRNGIPITLAVVAVEVGRRLGVVLNPIGFPGHFLLGDAEDPALFYDPFAAGQRLRLDECATRLRQMFPGAELNASHTAVLTSSQVGQRMLGNLKQIHLSQGNLSAAADVSDLSLAFPDAGIEHHAEAIKLFEATGRHSQAADVHDLLVKLDPLNAEGHRRAAGILRFHQN